MVTKKDKALELVKKAVGEKVGKVTDTQKALKEVKAKFNILKEVGKQWKEIKKELPTMTAMEKICRFGGLAALVTLAWLTKPEDIKHFMKGQGSAKEGETLEGTNAEKTYADNKKKAEEDVEDGEITEEEMEKEFDPKADEIISKKQSATNMYAIRYYRKDGSVYEKPNDQGIICRKAKAIPSTYILEKSYALFKDGVGSFDAFKTHVTDKLVHKSVKNKDKKAEKKERIRQAAVILSCCAVGRFQILPIYHFKRMGWSTRGEEGLRAMYNFIRSTERQIATFKKILSGQWNRFKDVGLVAIAYYAGEDAVIAYKKNPNPQGFEREQSGGHSSINKYANDARANFAKFKKEIPGLKDLDYVAMCMESNETGKGIIYSRAEQGMGISDMRAV